jgi:DNA-binding transcriptional MerR regulator
VLVSIHEVKGQAVRISELSARSDVPIATIKYYLREGLLPPGEQTSRNQATYGEAHLRRLRLVRALIEVGGLQLATVRATVAAIEDDSTSLHDAFGTVMHGLDQTPAQAPADDVATAHEEVREWLRARSWRIDAEAPAPHRLAESLAALRRFDFPVTIGDFDEAADAAEKAAGFEVRYARDRPDRTAAVETMLVGTVIYERALAEIRRLALEAASAHVGAEARGAQRPAT